MGRRIDTAPADDERDALPNRLLAMRVALLEAWDRAEPRLRHLEEGHRYWPRPTEVDVEIYERVVAELGLEQEAAKYEARFARYTPRRWRMAELQARLGVIPA